MNPSEGRDVQVPVMTAERRATHTGDPLVALSHVRAVTVFNTVILRAHSFRSPHLALQKNFIRIRALNDNKYVEVAQAVNVGTLMEIVGEEVLSIIPAVERQAVRDAVQMVRVYGALLSKLSGRLCVEAD